MTLDELMDWRARHPKLSLRAAKMNFDELRIGAPATKKRNHACRGSDQDRSASVASRKFG